MTVSRIQIGCMPRKAPQGRARGRLTSSLRIVDPKQVRKRASWLIITQRQRSIIHIYRFLPYSNFARLPLTINGMSSRIINSTFACPIVSRIKQAYYSSVRNSPHQDSIGKIYRYTGHDPCHYIQRWLHRLLCRQYANCRDGGQIYPGMPRTTETTELSLCIGYQECLSRQSPQVRSSVIRVPDQISANVKPTIQKHSTPPE